MKVIHFLVALTTGSFICSPLAHCQTDSQDVETRVDAIVKQMTFQEKPNYIGGQSGWSVKPISRLGLP